MAGEVKVYSTSTCPWCQRAKKFLQDNKVQFQNLDVASDAAARETVIKKTGQFGVPVIEVDGEFIIGFDEPKLREKLGLQK